MAEQVDYWDAQAESFDQEPDHGLSDPRTRAAWRDLLRRLIPGAGARVADLGCGTGTLAVLLAQEGHRVTGVDLSPRMIEHARAKAAAAAVDVAWQVGDASSPPLAAGRFDAVICRHVLWAMADPAAALGRWIELLDRDGRLVLIEGRWSTGAGLTARETADHLRSHGRDSEVIALEAPIFWGKPITDERYAVVSPPGRATGGGD